MDFNELKEVAKNILDVFTYSQAVVWSWGATDYKAIVFGEKPALSFRVNGFIHQEMVVVALDYGLDLYEIFLLNDDRKIVNHTEQVYFDELVEKIDKMVEKDCSTQQYIEKVDKYLQQTAI